MHEYTMTIGGESVQGGGSFGVLNPATEEEIARAPECSRAELDQAMNAAAEAYKGWRRDEKKRREHLQRCAAAITAKAAELAPILTQEQGKPLAKARQEIKAAAFWLQYASTLEIPVEVLADTETSRIEVRRRPLGVVAAITPWNFPVALASWKIGPALLAGNTVVLKPSPFTPLTTLKLGEILRDALPPGVLNVLSGGDELGAWMTSHPVPRKIAFTGSVATGKKVAAAAAPDLKRLTLELGGNDPAILLSDVDPKKVATKIFWGAFENCGQICSAIKRLYVPDELYEPIVRELAELARSAKIGDGMKEGTEIGPLNNRPQLDRVTELVNDAKQHGARVVAGGESPGGRGYFFKPTIVADVQDGTRLVDEEQFGPALPIIRYRTVEEAIERANDTHFGLSGSVWSSDQGRAIEIAKELECGTAWVNQHLAIVPNAPFGGAKWSGIGVENGPWGLLEFTEIQTVNAMKS
jgi:acyl-CoA reductase-like NAD-dependent aldehyde dehydrogenase